MQRINMISQIKYLKQQMKNYKILISLLLIIGFSFLFGCRKDEMSRKELKEYMRSDKNGVKQIKEYNGIKAEAFLIRPELIGDLYKRNPNTLDSLRYFMISFSKDGREALPQAGDIDKYSQLLNNLSFPSAQKCYVIEGNNDTLQIVNSSFSNTYGTGPSNNLLLVFKSKKIQSDCRLILEEIGFGFGKMKFGFKKKDIENFYSIHLTD